VSQRLVRSHVSMTQTLTPLMLVSTEAPVRAASCRCLRTMPRIVRMASVSRPSCTMYVHDHVRHHEDGCCSS
jgi:hypothetical protein